MASRTPPRLGGADQCLAGDAATIVASAAQRSGVEQADPFAQIAGCDGGGEATRAATEDEKVKIVVGHGPPFHWEDQRWWGREGSAVRVGALAVSAVAASGATRRAHRANVAVAETVATAKPTKIVAAPAL